MGKGEDYCLASELKEFVQKNIKLYFTDSDALFERAFAADCFATGMLILRLIGLEHCETDKVSSKLSAKAADFLLKAVHGHMDYRLFGPDALCHPWMLEAERISRA